MPEEMEGMNGLDTLDRDLRTMAEHGERHARGLPSADVRSRGGRRRTTRHLASAAALVLLVAGGAGVASSLTGDRVRTAPPAGPTLTESVLPETFLFYGADDEMRARWVAATTARRERSTDPVSVCQEGTLSSLGADEVLVRRYDWKQELTPGTVPGPGPEPAMRGAVAQFADRASARTAYETVRDWVEGCAAGEPRGAYSSVDQPTGTGVTYLLTYEETPPADPDALVFDAQAVGLTADQTRLVLVSQTLLGQDYNWEPDEAPVSRMLAEALDRADEPDRPVEGGR